MDMNKMMKECMKPHMMVHSITGLAVGLIILGLIPSLAANALMLGVIILIVGIIADMMVQNKK